MSDVGIHFICGGELIFKETLDYGYFDADVYTCSGCGQELDFNEGNYLGTREQYEYFKSRGWQGEHGKPRRLYPDYPKDPSTQWGY